MSEKQAKRNRQAAPEQEQVKVKKSAGQIWTNVGIGVVVAGFLVLAGFALKPTVQTMFENYKASQPVETVTVESYAKEQGMTADEFLAEYGLTDNENVTKETAIDSAKFNMSLENFAKFSDMTVDDFRANYGLEGNEEVTNDMTYLDVVNSMKAGAVVKDMGLDFETFKTTYGMPDTVTETMTWGEVNAIAEAIYAQAAEATSAAEDTADAADTADTETPAAE